AITEEIANLARRGPSTQALARARNRLEFTFLSHYDTLQGVATRLNHYAMSGAPARFAEDYARREKVTAESVKSAVAQWLDTPNRLVIRFEPDGTSWKPAPEPDRTEAPPLRPDSPLRLPAIQSARLGNGMDVFVVE